MRSAGWSRTALTFELRIADEPVAEATGFRNALYAAGTIAAEEDALVETFDVVRGLRIATTWTLENGSASHQLSQGTQRFYREAGQL